MSLRRPILQQQIAEEDEQIRHKQRAAWFVNNDQGRESDSDGLVQELELDLAMTWFRI